MKTRAPFASPPTTLAVLVLLSSTAAGIEPYAPECDDCGLNAATVGDGIIFDNMNVDGLPNNGGVSISNVSYCRSGFFPDHCGEIGPARLEVTGDVLSALPLDGGRPPIRGWDLVKLLRIQLEHQDGAQYELFVTELRKQDFRRVGSGHATAYRFLYRMIRASPTRGTNTPLGLRELCTGEPETQEERYLALVYEGDRFDNRAKTAMAPIGPGWFNLACSGTTLWKMHLFKHTRASRPESEKDEKQTLLKLITADYCGTGTSYTENGKELRYMDVDGWVPPKPRIDLERDSGLIEAIWDANGAICIGKVRLDKHSPRQTVLGFTCPARPRRANPLLPGPIGPPITGGPQLRFVRACTGEDARWWFLRGKYVSFLSR